MGITDEALRQRAQALLADCDPKEAGPVAFRGAQFDAGLAMVHFPEGKGGLGISRGKQAVVNEVLATGSAVYHDLVVNPIGIGMGAPVVLTYGTDAMHERYLRPIFTGEEVWCQMFSEPSHGSDVAGIPGRAVRDGDEYVVNGQKVWTTRAHEARFGMLLTRTDPDVPKHRGLSYFLLDMTTPGVEVRPLFQVTGEAEFNEVFLTDVRVPAANRLGDEGDGWRVATTTLMNERVALGAGDGGRGAGPIRRLLQVWAQAAPLLTPSRRAVYQDRVVALWARSEALRFTGRRAKAASRHGNPGPEGSVTKLMAAELSQDVFELTLDLQGAAGTLHEAGYPMTRSSSAVHHAPSGQFLRSRANTIEGGTSEIMRNILGERILGLPADIRVDKDVPWSQVPR